MTRRGEVVVEGHDVGRIEGFDFVPDPLAVERRGRRQHLAHPRPAARPLVADDDDVAVLVAALFDRGEKNFQSGYDGAAMDKARGFAGKKDEPEIVVLAHDAQTSGGLLLATPPAAAGGLLADLAGRGLTAADVGQVTTGRPGQITLRGAAVAR